MPTNIYVVGNRTHDLRRIQSRCNTTEPLGYLLLMLLSFVVSPSPRSRKFTLKCYSCPAGSVVNPRDSHQCKQGSITGVGTWDGLCSTYPTSKFYSRTPFFVVVFVMVFFRHIKSAKTPKAVQTKGVVACILNCCEIKFKQRLVVQVTGRRCGFGALFKVFSCN